VEAKAPEQYRKEFPNIFPAGGGNPKEMGVWGAGSEKRMQRMNSPLSMQIKLGEGGKKRNPSSRITGAGHVVKNQKLFFHMPKKERSERARQKGGPDHTPGAQAKNQEGRYSSFPSSRRGMSPKKASSKDGAKKSSGEDEN